MKTEIAIHNSEWIKDKIYTIRGEQVMLDFELAEIYMQSENDEHVEAAKLAVCAQCQDWIEREVSAVANENISSFSLGELSITYSNVDKYSNKLSSVAVRYLNNKHLLYKGMR